MRRLGLLVASIFLLATPWLSPGVTRPYPAMAVAAGGGIALLAALATLWLPPARRARPLLFLLAGLVGWMGLSTLTSLSVYHSQRTLAAWMGAAALVLLLTQCIRNEKDWREVASSLIFWGGALSLYALVAWARSPSIGLNGTFSNADSFSVIPLLAGLLALGLGLAPGLRWLWFYWATCALLLGTALCSASRSAILGVLVGVPVLMLAVRGQDRRTRLSPLVVLLPLVVVGLILLATGLLNRSVERVQSALSGRDHQGVSMRQDILVYGFEAGMERPLLGSGPGTFALAYQEFRPVRQLFPASQFVNVAHNDYVEVLVELGSVGFGLWMGVLGTTFWVALRRVRRAMMPAEAAGVIGALAGVCTFCTLNFLISIPALLYWLFALLALGVSIPGRRSPRPLPGWVRLLTASVLVVIGLWVIVFAVRVHQVDGLLARARQHASMLQWEQAVDELSRAIEILPGRAELYVERARSRQDLAVFRGDLKTAAPAIEKDLSKAEALSPLDQGRIARAAALYRNLGRYQEAESLLSEAHQMIPYQDWILEDLFRIQLLTGKTRDAAVSMRELATRDEKRIPQLAVMLARLEQTRRGAGAALLRQWLEEGDNETIRSVGEKAGKLLLEEKEYDASEKFFAVLVQVDPSNRLALYHQALSARGRNDHAAEAVLAEKLLKICQPGDPDYYQALDLATSLALRQGQVDQALAKLESARESDPSNVPIQLLLSTALLDQGRVSRAHEVVAQGLQDHPNDARLLARKSTLLWAEGSYELARSYARDALARDPSNKEAREIQKRPKPPD
ncbi:MAG: hypothetical protein AMXMBFR33_73050 [Candidatus Xenobia bacterium]